MFFKLIKSSKKSSKKLFKLALSHKLIASICLLVIIFGGYFIIKTISKKEEQVRYVTAAVEKGTLITSVSGTGQVSSSELIDIKPDVSGNVVYIGARKGQEVKVGTLLVQIDSSDAQKAVRDAETALETAKLELDKLLEPIDELDLLKAENNLAQAKESKQKAEDNIIEAYEDAFNAIANAFLDLPTIIIALRDILHSEEIADNEPSVPEGSTNMSALINSVSSKYYDDRHKLEEFIDTAENDYKTARAKYNENFENYKDASRYSEQEIFEALLEETIDTTRAMSETAKSQANMLDFWVDYRSRKDLRIFKKVTEYQSDLGSYTSKINSHLSSLLNIQRSLQDSREDALNAERSVEELELSFAELKAGADALDIRAKKITVQKKRDDLLDARQNLADHYIRAPFDGVIAEIDIRKGESISSNTVAATLITKQRIAEITLNEIDIAKVKTGQKTTITFDAVEDLSITGEVVEVDIIGSATQGVVTYDVKLVFDTQDERIKPGMSMSAAVITDIKQNVLIIPNSAVKYQGDVQYVQVMADSNTLHSQQVEIGISNDTHTEIVNGIKEGDKVVTQTTGSSQSSSNSSNGGRPSGGGSFMRMMR